MATDDDFDRLLREVDAVTGNSPSPAAPQRQQEQGEQAPGNRGGIAPGRAAPGESGRELEPAAGPGSRGRWIAISAAGAGAAGFLIGSFGSLLPYVGGIETGLGAALGGALIALVGQPPRWLR